MAITENYKPIRHTKRIEKRLLLSWVSLALLSMSILDSSGEGETEFGGREVTKQETEIRGDKKLYVIGESKPFTGTVLTKVEGPAKFQIRNGVEHGVQIIYFLGSNDREIEYYAENGKKHGRCRSWHSNLTLESEAIYVKGKRNGIVRHWTESGQLKLVVCLSFGKREGISTWYYENGKIMRLGSYKNDLHDGVWREWNEDGSLKSEKWYVKGKESTASQWLDAQSSSDDPEIISPQKNHQES